MADLVQTQAVMKFNYLPTLFGNQPRGWSEVYYNMTADIGAVADGPFTRLMKARLKFLHRSCILVYAKCTSTEGLRRVAIPNYLPNNGLRGLITADQINNINNCLLFRFRDATYQSVKRTECHGIPDSWVAEDNLDNAGNAAVPTVCGAFIDNIIDTNNGWGTRSRSDSDEQLIGRVETGTTGKIEITVQDNAAFSSGDRVIVSRCNANPMLNGIWEVFAIANPPVVPQPIIVLSKSSTIGAGSNQAGGFISLLEYTGHQITNGYSEGFNERKTGKPLVVPAGRGKARLVHR